MTWENSEWELKCEFCHEPTPNNPCENCCKAIEELEKQMTEDKDKIVGRGRWHPHWRPHWGVGCSTAILAEVVGMIALAALLYFIISL